MFVPKIGKNFKFRYKRTTKFAKAAPVGDSLRCLVRTPKYNNKEYIYED